MTQKEALDILKLGHNVFLTGPAGSGKTYLLNQYIAYLRQHAVAVGITASTGIAATHMGGTTIHSWTGMGIRDQIVGADLGELLKRYYLRTRFKNTKVLIIDEISMLHDYRLDMVDTICQAFKQNSNPFGGMQVIMCGDFFQLPPVSKVAKLQSPTNTKIETVQATIDFVYQSHAWNSMNLRICYLDEQHRQDDRALLRILNDIRNNEVSEMTYEYLAERLNKKTEGYVSPTRLFTHNADVDAINTKHLRLLSGEEHEYTMQWAGSYGLVETLRKSCLAPEKLVLKKGARVMFVKNNYEAGYVNGTIGEVIDFKDGSPLVRTFDGNEILVAIALWEVKEEEVTKASLTQLPLRLAWAITIHKSQGMSLDAAEIDLSRSFTPGMGYVALSRVRSLSGLKLMGLNQMALQINPAVAVVDQNFIAQSHEARQYLLDFTSEKKQQMQVEFMQYLQKK
jgi:ATP-dependent exoDNAse (exonuclease V) alpha subunit